MSTADQVLTDAFDDDNDAIRVVVVALTMPLDEGVVYARHLALDAEVAYSQLEPPEDWHSVGEAGEPAFATGWAQGGVTDVCFCKIGELVFLEGTATRSAGTTTVYTLPPGYRPAVAVSAACTATSPTITDVAIASTGVVAANVASGQSIVFHIVFRAA